MKLEEFAALVNKMRQAQKEYFRTRSLSAIDSAKKLEREVDKALAHINDKQGAHASKNSQRKACLTVRQSNKQPLKHGRSFDVDRREASRVI